MAYFMHKRTKALVQILPVDPGLGVDVVEYMDPETGEPVCVSKELFESDHDPAPSVDQMESDIADLVASTFSTNATTGA